MFIVDERVQDIVRRLLPEDIRIQVVDLLGGRPDTEIPFDQPVLGAISLRGHGGALKTALSDGPLAGLEIIELDPERPQGTSGAVLDLLVSELRAASRQAGEMRAAAARLRAENMDLELRLRDIESLLYSLGSPQFINALAWQPTGRMLKVPAGRGVTQALPMNAVGLSAIDLWFPAMMAPRLGDLAVAVEDTSGNTHPLLPARHETGLETGWMRFALPEPIRGAGRDCRLRVECSGAGPIALGLGQAVPDPRFRACADDGPAPEETLALRAWKSMGGVRLPGCAPLVSSDRAVRIRDTEYLPAGALPRPEIFAAPVQANDHVSTAYWEKEDALLVHPSRVGPVCAIIRDVDLAGLSHVSALVTVGHVRAPNLNFCIGVAPHGRADVDGLWQRRMGPWVTGLPPRGWAQAHCIPAEPITGRADLLLAVSLAGDVPNDFSWGLFQGFRFSIGEPAGEIPA